MPLDEAWFGRNRKLVIAGLLASFAFFGVAIVVLVFGALRSSRVYTEALAHAQVHPEVKEALGEPVEAGFFVAGSVNVSGSAGDADLAIPISGPQGSGTLYAVAEKRSGRWLFERLEVEVEGRDETIPLR